MSSNEQSEKPRRAQHVTTKTGRILRVTDAQIAAAAAPTATAVQADFDPARRTDVLFRVRRDEGHELSSWWMIGAFLVTSGVVIALLSWVPGGA
ncbi:hypothetical protein FM104_06455 [Microbacterium esteraromaticum]|uniref:UDP-N-acetylmuramyl pentapeptide phosphotransferase n=1 Tax=Microbacterium esteraromaticum TaxID=57043 RepID=A0A1R4JBB5_9MICO|nr:hypothetical protein [Microbacterium esteraromaticum]SJN29328.1 hypothetical protein FM104_06455 [Microbacterium esteraromaticum]